MLHSFFLKFRWRNGRAYNECLQISVGVLGSAMLNFELILFKIQTMLVGPLTKSPS